MYNMCNLVQFTALSNGHTHTHSNEHESTEIVDRYTSSSNNSLLDLHSRLAHTCIFTSRPWGRLMPDKSNTKLRDPRLMVHSCDCAPCYSNSADLQ